MEPKNQIHPYMVEYSIRDIKNNIPRPIVLLIENIYKNTTVKSGYHPQIAYLREILPPYLEQERRRDD